MKNEFTIYSDVDDTLPERLQTFLQRAGGQPVVIRFNSAGGSALAGIAAHNILSDYAGQTTAIIDGMCLSAASLIAMGCDEVHAHENSWMMIHSAANDVSGDATTLREMASLLDGLDSQMASIYAGKSRKPLVEIRRMLAAETWLDGEQAHRAGFVTKVLEPLAVAASFDPSRFPKFPRVESRQKESKRNWREVVAALARANSMSFRDAAREVDKIEPMLRQEFVAAANRKQPAVASQKTGAAAAKWHAAIIAKMSNGLSKANAVRQIVAEDPAMHAAYIAEHNGR